MNGEKKKNIFLTKIELREPHQVEHNKIPHVVPYSYVYNPTEEDSHFVKTKYYNMKDLASVRKQRAVEVGVAFQPGFFSLDSKIGIHYAKENSHQQSNFEVRHSICSKCNEMFMLLILHTTSWKLVNLEFMFMNLNSFKH